MSMTPPEPVELPDQSRRTGAGSRRSGLLATALPAPAGWERGLAIPWYGCGEPILRDKCVRAEDEAHRPYVVTYPPFPIEQGSTCSTLSGLDQSEFATGRLDATTEWALGRQLATDQVGTGAPSFEDAEVLGVLTEDPEDVVDAIACLEQAAADVGFGTQWWLHTSPRGAAYARRYKMIDADGYSPSGGRWIVSPGYPSTGETEDTVRFWVTGPVWAAVDAPQVNAATDWRANDDSAYALRAGIVAFDPCINFAYDVTVGTCGRPEAAGPTLTYPADGATVSPYAPFVGDGCGPNQTVGLWAEWGGEAHQIDSGTTRNDGSFRFVGTTPIADGTHEFWVTCGGSESNHATVTVAAGTEETFDWEARTGFSLGQATVVIQQTDGTLPAGDYTVTATGTRAGGTFNIPVDQVDADYYLVSTEGDPGVPFTIDIAGPYGIAISVAGTSPTSTETAGVLDSGTVTYTR